MGRSLLYGVGSLETTRVNSGLGSVDGDLVVGGVEYGDTGATRTSRHSLGDFCGVAVAEVVIPVVGDGTDWKTWIGRASKNS